MREELERQLSRAYDSAYYRSKKKKIPFCLSKKDLIEIYDTQNGICFYSGIKMNVSKNKEHANDPYKMSVDCVDPDKGYVKENIVLCLFCVNSLKQKMKVDEMLLICSKISERNNEKKATRSEGND